MGCSPQQIVVREAMTNCPLWQNSENLQDHVAAHLDAASCLARG